MKKALQISYCWTPEIPKIVINKTFVFRILKIVMNEKIMFRILKIVIYEKIMFFLET